MQIGASAMVLLVIVAVTFSTVALAVSFVVASRRTGPVVTGRRPAPSPGVQAQLDELEATIQRLTLWTMGGRR